MRKIGFAAGLLAGAAAAAMAAQASGFACAELKELRLENVRITAAERVEPGWKYPASPFNGSLGPRAVAHSSFCRVALTIEKEIKVEVWLPDIWNQRFEAVGNGGLTGGINFPSMADVMRSGFATASTDTGHETPTGFFDSSWVKGHPDRVENFGHRAHHLMAMNAKKIIAAYYGTGPKKSYYTGCSSGGWQGLTEAQRYPEDYDGIVAGAPAINFVRLQANAFALAWRARQIPNSDIPYAKLSLIAKAQIAQCDAQDGVKDGFITDPRQCKFDWSKLLCKKDGGTECLTKAQIARAKTLYGPQRTPKAQKLYPGKPLGILANAPVEYPAGSDPLETLMLPQALKEKPKWTATSFDPDRDLPALGKELGPILNSTNPDLSAFKARGGKLIMYHGWADNVLSPYNSIDYAANVTKKTPGAENFLRLFMVPSMGHCGGGEGPNSFDSNSAIVNWVEKSEAPDVLIATHTGADGGVTMTRPLCAEPKVAVYKGEGSTNDAANFICKMPNKKGE
ncbi:feruloyl esterase [Rhizomicrobium palustre]|uniref:Feruloyl esterase n=1 Tax=Rhizomicrobium palustre TaxID=189966 RepID=A0A846MXT7_9PROT|nr:tannase/feruloyl esterase family alpha/beta hydrolase [Rhizomicrobium palustre]NIK87872.1 feruloyl esterase [Rhizomicrobium palustre]